MAIEFIDMFHPGLGTTARASRKAFDDVWSKKGWVLDATEIEDEKDFSFTSDVEDDEEELETDD